MIFMEVTNAGWNEQEELAEQLKYYTRAKDTFEDATEEFDDGAYTDAERKAKVIPPHPLSYHPAPLRNGHMFTCVHSCCAHAWIFVCTCTCLCHRTRTNFLPRALRTITNSCAKS
jgi:hypothetical protein